jgi:RluA family pseudouridine synthase
VVFRRGSFVVPKDHAGKRLDQLLGEWLPDLVRRPMSKGEVRRLIMARAVSVDGRPARHPGMQLAEGARLLARLRLEALDRRALVEDRAARLSASAVLYQDQALLVVDKPPGLPMHPSADAKRPSLVGAVLTLLSAQAPAGSERASGSGGARGLAPTLAVHQRLDRDTSGVVLFALDPRVNGDLAAQFAGRTVVKVYHALCARPNRLPPKAWTAEDPVGQAVGGAQGRMAVLASGGQSATTAFRLLRVLDRGLLVEAEPHTGLKHQIRLHLAGAGMPILGDPLYGRDVEMPKAPRLMLHASRLSLRHPLTGAPLTIESPWPADFRAALEALGEREPKAVGRDPGAGSTRRSG